MSNDQVEVVPCTEYKFRVAGYEMFQGTGRIFPVYSKQVQTQVIQVKCQILNHCLLQVNFTLNYSPKFIKQPIVYEKVLS